VKLDTTRSTQPADAILPSRNIKSQQMKDAIASQSAEESPMKLQKIIKVVDPGSFSNRF
jgi:hypothetical protein